MELNSSEQQSEHTLFDSSGAASGGAEEDFMSQDAPLSTRMRPRTLDEFVGQEHILGHKRALRVAIEEDKLTSCIFYGPTGCGKTTLAYIIARMTKAHFERFSAVTAGVNDVKRVVSEARMRRKRFSQRTILFVDEIHRFNRAQQDAFLPHVEDGTIILIGATTENPFFSLNAPLLSRSRIYRFEPLAPEHIRIIVERALKDEERGLGKLELKIDENALRHLCERSNGDARRALDALELAAAIATSDTNTKGGATITLPLVEDALQEVAVIYDKAGDSHYDTISAFIKSIRGSDPDAALYWLAKMLCAGEDPRFIARRLVIHASEDIGNADPIALLVASAAAQAVELVGMPEAQLVLAQATIYLATAPKSNSCCLAIGRAMKDIEERGAMPVPKHLRDASYAGAKRLKHGVGYLYPHDYPEHYVPQEYLPEGAKSQPYYIPTNMGFERVIGKRMERWKMLKETTMRGNREVGGGEVQIAIGEGDSRELLRSGGDEIMNRDISLSFREDGIAVVSPNGELDLSTAEALRERLNEALLSARVGVIVNLRDVTFMDSVTFGILLGAMRRAKERGIQFVLASPSEHDRKIISMTRLDEVFEIHDDLVSAVNSILSARG
ncbi:MAG: anti-sigma factor antagonist [Armatimonadota bacterium]|nr:anti-sigma factor antagonist [Armatimonadota bacterium]